MYEKINTDCQLVRTLSASRHFKICLLKRDWVKFCLPCFNETNNIPYSEQYLYGFDYGIKEKINALMNQSFKNTELSLIHHHHINLVSCDITSKINIYFIYKKVFSYAMVLKILWKTKEMAKYIMIG